MNSRIVLGVNMLLLGVACVACSGTPPEASPAPAAAQASVSCPPPSTDGDPARKTSKLRHVPDEALPCPDSRGSGRTRNVAQ